ncbi:MAG: hypothetical protein IT297_04630 [Anaerolineae bacterium]|jgi:DNA-directed RNA polymerase subunit RPC12/RpoP|nr:hypothetical protein [Anaerolineae bacterium]MCZ7554286.1 hypothetical protein [Anaerolineales bacterium]
MDTAFPPPGFVPVPSAIEGIEVFQPAPPDEEQLEETVDFKCPQCGATTAYSVASGGLTCAHCGYFEAPNKPLVGQNAQELEFTVQSLERSAQGWGEVRLDLACQNCGAQTSIPVDNISDTCPFCGSNRVVHHQAAQDILRPWCLIPFKIEAEQCNRIAAAWLTNSWMVPASLKNRAGIHSFYGIYLPFWTFDALTKADWKAEVGHIVTERYFENGEWKTRVVTEWRWESGHAEETFDDLIIRGTDRIGSRLLTEISNFNLTELAPYEPKYLAGLGAKAYDIPLEKSWEMARGEMRERTRQACVQQASTSQVRNFSMKLDFDDEQWRYILLPVYLTSYIHQDQKYQVVVNGQNGIISGQQPADWNKIWLVIGLLLTPGLLLGLIGLITIPVAGAGIGIGAFGFVLLVLGLVLSAVIYQKAQALDDL